MSESLNNKELVAVGHQFAKAMSSDTAIMDIAKMVTLLAERLDCTTAALREMAQRYDGLPENTLKIILLKGLNDRSGLKYEYCRKTNNVCDHKTCCAEGLGQGVLTKSIGCENKSTVISIQLPKLTGNDLDVFKGKMLKALMVGEGITKKAVIKAMQEYGISIRFIR